MRWGMLIRVINVVEKLSWKQILRPKRTNMTLNILIIKDEYIGESRKSRKE